MRFEHAIDVNVNPPDQPALAPLTPKQVWQGLWLRVWRPDMLPNGPSDCTCTPAPPLPTDPPGSQRLQRQLRFGSHAFHDTVLLVPDASVAFHPEAHDETAPIGLTITLSEPTSGQPRLTFVYEALAAMSEDEQYYSGYRQNAWRHADHDMVGTWRIWLAQGVWPVEA